MNNTINLLLNETLKKVSALKDEKNNLKKEQNFLEKKVQLLEEKLLRTENENNILQNNDLAKQFAQLLDTDKSKIKKEINTILKIIDKIIATLKTDFMP